MESADAVLAVKPDDAAAAGARLREAGVTRVLSIAAGITTAALQAVLDDGARVIRAMPNTPALVGAGAAAISAGSHATDEDLVWATGILEAVGTVVVCDESMLDAVTGLSGSGPAYVFWLAENLMAAGVGVGLSSDMADALTRQTILGAARLLIESGELPADLRAAVTSPGGPLLGVLPSWMPEGPPTHLWPRYAPPLNGVVNWETLSFSPLAKRGGTELAVPRKVSDAQRSQGCVGMAKPDGRKNS